jgi:hypothetical protein
MSRRVRTTSKKSSDEAHGRKISGIQNFKTRKGLPILQLQQRFSPVVLSSIVSRLFLLPIPNLSLSILNSFIITIARQIP